MPGRTSGNNLVPRPGQTGDVKMTTNKKTVVLSDRSITTLNAPLATSVDLWYCGALTTLNAPLAASVVLRYCGALTTLNAPQATSVDLRSCGALTTLDAPQANVEVIHCPMLRQ